MKAQFVRMEWENTARTVATFYFRPTSSFRYEAGQYVVISMPHDGADNRGHERTMTLSSSPHEPLLSLTMRLYAEGGSSFKKALLGIQPESEITIYDAMGDLVLPLDSSTPLVFIAGGVGITSYVGMTKWLLHTQDKRNISLLYTVTEPNDIVLQKPFQDYSLFSSIAHSVYISSSYKPRITEQHFTPGRLNASDILPFLKVNSLVYISGTESMVESVRSDLIQSGFSGQQIVFDYFDGYTSL